MEFTYEKFNEIKNKAVSEYNKIGKVKCPYFNQEIHFNSKGLDHLIFKKWNKTRPISDQFSRFRYLHLARDVIASSKTVQGIWIAQKFERVRKNNGSWHQLLKLTSYYEFIAVLESHESKVRVKVIVKQIDGGEKFFFSIIPFWGRNKSGERVMHTGDPEND